ncbi:hypothetical protein V9T40_006270 [Parthenolecanium corni]|uniref:Cytochrome P450 n=1 Tax=Parthenolecanium corni TaxID=536013 RepID=A0AAN9TXJ9_9HEMI
MPLTPESGYARRDYVDRISSQEKLYAEINQLFGTDPRPAEESDFKKLPYLDQVIRETLRLFTIIPAIPRQIENDTQIGAHLYPKDTILIVNIAGIHHNPKLYPEPYKFSPDNFTPEAVSKRHRHSSIPFGAGPRNCIGKEFTQLMMKLSLVALLRTFSFHTSIKLEDIKLKPGPVETISGGYPIKIKLRDEGARH